MPVMCGTGARIYALKDGTVKIVSPENDKYEPEDGAIALRVEKASIHFQIEEIIRADLSVFCAFEPIGAVPTYWAINPEKQAPEKVKSITFESGEKWERPNCE